MTRASHSKTEIREYLSRYKAEKGCADCGINNPLVLDFDHIKDKKYNISRMVHDGFLLKEIKKEMAKCEVVCSNCHRIRTYFRLKKKAV